MLGEAAVWVCGRAGREKKAGAAGGPAHLGLVCPPRGGAQTLYQEGLEEPEQERSGLRMVF